MAEWTRGPLEISKRGALVAGAKQRSALVVCEHGFAVLSCRRIDMFSPHDLHTVSHNEMALLGALCSRGTTYSKMKSRFDSALKRGCANWANTVHTDCVGFGRSYEYRTLTVLKCTEHVWGDATADLTFEVYRPYRLPPRLCLFRDGTETAVWPEEDDAMFVLCVALAALDWPVLILLELFDALVAHSGELYTTHRQWQVAQAVKERALKLKLA